jgi:hypothetical protein
MRRGVALLLIACACASGNGDVRPPDAASLVRDGARPVIVRRGDLDGDGVVEVVVASVSETPTTFGLPTPYLEVFAHRDDGWRKVFDASGNAPEGEDTPDVMLEAADEEFAVGQSVDLLEVVDLAHDGTREIVTAISSVGATAGPLDLWILSMHAAADLHADYYMRTERGGRVAINGDRVAIEFGVYKRKDPGCCPSSFELRTIGYDPGQGAIVTLKRERHSLKAT